METNQEEEERVPQIVKDEPDDKPAGRGVIWAIVIAVIILSLIYVIFFKNSSMSF